MKKALAIILAVTVLASAMLIGCSKNNGDESTTADGFAENSNEVEFVEETVTDENGEAVTDADGNVVTELVAYQYTTDKNGNKVLAKIDSEGNLIYNSNGELVTVTPTPAPTQTEAPSTTTTTMKNNGENTTSAELTTLDVKSDKVPSTNESGKKVYFEAKDQTAIKDMLEVPYLYLENYENVDGVPINIAAHAAIWMAQRDNLNTKTYASGTVVLDLFKYFGQTVINFKTNCNEKKGNANITYNSGNDTFSIPNAESSTHKVSLTSIEFLGNNNYYKVTGTVSGAGSISKVTAIIQKNRLDQSLGFSIKALKWS